jgi:hypothetical protein
MNRRKFLYGVGGVGALGTVGLPGFALPDATPSRSLIIAASKDASPAIREAVRSIAEAKSHPLIEVFTGPQVGKIVTSQDLLSASLAERAYNHLILVGLPEDPLIKTAWQREARRTDTGFYVFGFGEMRGNIGYIESDRNLFLHSATVKVAPFETQVVTITGNNDAGVLLAVNSFLSSGLVNGVVASSGWSRGTSYLLERDPLTARFDVPELAPTRVNGLSRIGLTQASEDEYRGVLADTGLMPTTIWRAKYFTPGAWDHADSYAAYDAYSFGLHRRAYGNTRWIAEFVSEADAKSAAPKIAGAAQLHRKGDSWAGNQPYYGGKDWGGGQEQMLGPLTLHQNGKFVLMSTVPND